jgi:hypothetical protein
LSQLEKVGGHRYPPGSTNAEYGSQAEEGTTVELGSQAKEGTNVELGSQAKEGTNVELGSQAKRFSSNLTSILIIISLQCD